MLLGEKEKVCGPWWFHQAPVTVIHTKVHRQHQLNLMILKFVKQKNKDTKLCGREGGVGLAGVLRDGASKWDQNMLYKILEELIKLCKKCSTNSHWPPCTLYFYKTCLSFILCIYLIFLNTNLALDNFDSFLCCYHLHTTAIWERLFICNPSSVYVDTAGSLVLREQFTPWVRSGFSESLGLNK